MASCNKKNILDAQAIAEKDPFSTRNNIRVTAAYADGSGEGELTITPECLNPRGAVHGGCLATLANAVSGWALQQRHRQLYPQLSPSGHGHQPENPLPGRAGKTGPDAVRLSRSSPGRRRHRGGQRRLYLFYVGPISL